MAEATRARAVGFNHVAIEVGDMRLTHPSKNATAIKELTDKGMAP